MRRLTSLVLALIAALALTAPVGASHVENIEEAINEALATYPEDPVAAKAALYAIATDPDIPPKCAQWADVNLAGLVLIDGQKEHMDSWAISVLFNFVLEALPVIQNDCLLAL